MWERKEGGFVIRSLVTERATGRRREIKRVLPNADLPTAVATLARETSRVRDGLMPTGTSKTRFAVFAADIFDHQKRSKKLNSVASESKWRVALGHLIAGVKDKLGKVVVPGFGAHFIEELQPVHLEKWHADVTADLIATGLYTPTTCNTWRAILRVVLGFAQRRLSLSANLADAVPVFDTREHDPYPAEEPNALPPERIEAFATTLRRMYPQHFAMTMLGLFLGMRPSTLRPLRRCGDTPDVLWDKGEILLRRSQTRGERVMNSTKTGTRSRIGVPPFLMDILRWHVETQLVEGKQQDSELLFPSTTGGFRAPTVLNKPFKVVAEEVGLGHKFTQRGLRRTFQDMARNSQIEAIVTRSISGHATETMHAHYSTVSAKEKALAIEQMAKTVGVLQASDEAAAE